MTNDERDQLRYKKMVKDGVTPVMAARCLQADRKPSWRIDSKTWQEPRVKPWRCKTCGMLLYVANCLECHNQREKTWRQNYEFTRIRPQST